MGSLRITGMASGMDTDATVKQMMKPYNMRVDKMKQDRQIVAWRQELYRDILSDVDTIKKTFFDTLKPDTNVINKNSYAGFDLTTTNSVEGQSAGVSATASLGAVAGSYSVNVTQLAASAKVDGGAINESNGTFSVGDWKGKTIKFQVGATTAEILIDNVDFVNKDALMDNINDKLAAKTELAGKITVSAGVGGGIKFNALTNYSVKIIPLTEDEKTAGKVAVVTEMDNVTGKVINPNRYTTKLSDLGIIADGKLKFDYKDSTGATKTSEITVSKDATISQLMDAVSQGTSGGVKLNFSELTNEFSLESLQTGSSASLTVTDTNSVLANLKLNLIKKADGTSVTYVSGTAIAGTDAKVTITPPGIGAVATSVTKSSNTFSIDGVNYTLTKAGTTNNITVTGNSQKTYDKIKGFIDKYNELVDKIGQKTDEKKQNKYLPLSDEQKKDMKEDEIKQWESKAKVGLLKGDSSLDSMLNSMRSAFFQGVKGVGVSLSEIGLSTSPIISQKGKIIIDEKKLKTAIETKGEQVADFFAKQSTTSYSQENTVEQRKTRNEEQGIFQKINDILQDYTKSIGKKGILVQKSGIKGDTESILSKDIIKKDKKINEMIRNLAVRENKYYLQFSKLETAMNKLNSQSSWLTQQLGGGQ